ncbi:hypothetical protein HYH03_000136 [Edaphochlamys debaryana]|uniref:Hydroxymethylglutaryl-CoA synthase n=1 Tax=Edaphochlamys debaryana TaxID=47281 RepID=A0A835YFK0_9CHLO|nr:hypothetical protein HYH03_000136 [Edaphochlamys debaryana]|eukprot:KAG2501631.1 hypothetical protein HYH03_000136 [Edaphochlamys debaryana]
MLSAESSSPPSASWRHGPDLPRPEAVGILAVSVYVPRQKVSMSDLEAVDCCPGKYRVGLGQDEMAFVSDREDAASMALTAAHTLMERYSVRPEEIGHVQVATESGVDRSKSIKSHLLSLFNTQAQAGPGPGPGPGSKQQPGGGEAGGADGLADARAAAVGPPSEGADVVHACFGGTAALMAAVAWVESRRWDGRLALVVASDVALYAPGSPARATGGCGAAALLVGPDAPLVLDPLWYGTHGEHAYDFWKPLGRLPYPAVDGPLTLDQFLGAEGRCALRLAARLEAAGELRRGEALLPRCAAFLSHAPFNKLLRKGLARVALMDELRRRAAEAERDAAGAGSADRREGRGGGGLAPAGPSEAAPAAAERWVAEWVGEQRDGGAPAEASCRAAEEGQQVAEAPGPLRGLDLDPAKEGVPYESYPMWRLGDKGLEGALAEATQGLWGSKAEDGAWLQKQVGNSYTASLWQGLASLVWRRGPALGGRRLLLYSYGSGTLASLFSLVGRAGSGTSGRGSAPSTATEESTNGFAGHVEQDPGPADPRFTLEAMRTALALGDLMASRTARSVEQYDAVAKQVEAAYGAPAPYEPVGDLADVAPGAYCLTRVDEIGRRRYERKALT